MLDLQKLDQELVLARVWELELVKGLAAVRELERVLHWQAPVTLLQGRASKVALSASLS